MTEKVLVPDVGDAEEVTVVEILVAVGDKVAEEDSLVVLESEKASMEIPSPVAGTVTEISVSEGDTVDEGDVILQLETDEASSGADAEKSGEKAGEPDSGKATEGGEEESQGAEEESEAEDEAVEETEESAGPEKAGKGSIRTVTVPDVGNAQEVVAVEILVEEGDQVEAEDSLVVLESDKASMEIPAPAAGTIKQLLISAGQEVEEGDELLVIEIREEKAKKKETGKKGTRKKATKQKAAKSKEKQEEKPEPEQKVETGESGDRPVAPQGRAEERPGALEDHGGVHAGPAVRKEAREYGVNLGEVKGTGPSDRILKEDIQRFVKERLSKGAGGGIPAVPAVDFSKYGEIEYLELSRIRRTSARNLHRSWLNVPHVTQFDEADITDLEAFRKARNEELKNDGVKLSPLAFLIKICVDALIRHPRFNASLDGDIERLVLKKYYNIGIAVDTEDGLVVPVIKNADRKGVVELARESADLASKARDKALPLDAMQGATFTISSLGGIGGTAFTPIVNAPEVAILGVSRADVKPVFDGREFRPRTILPLSLSYDHRAIDGAEAVRFTRWLVKALSDARHILM